MIGHPALLVLLACGGEPPAGVARADTDSGDTGAADPTGDSDTDGDPPLRDDDGDGFDEGVDCDDSDASVFPGSATADDCRVPLDGDCDGRAVCGASDQDVTVFSDYFQALAIIEDFDGDTTTELGFHVRGGAIQILTGAQVVEAGTGLVPAEHVAIHTPVTPYTTDVSQAVGGGDVDGDGRGDLVVGYNDDDLSTYGVELYVFDGVTLAGGGDLDREDAAWTFGGAVGQPPGSAVGDVTGDGFDDIAVASSYETVWVLAPAEIGRGAHDLEGAAAASVDGYVAPAADDFDGDGWPDLLVPQLEGYGATLVLHDDLVLGGHVAAADASARFEEARYAAGAPGDLDGDGAPDLWLGDWGEYGEIARESGVGAVWIAYGSDLPRWLAGDTEAPVRLEGMRTYDEVGRRDGVSGLGDWDGDGRAELVIGSSDGPFDGPVDDEGFTDWRVCIFPGGELPAAGVLAADACSVGLERLTSGGVDAAVQVYGTGDFDGDGRRDLAIQDWETRIWYGWEL
jgi:hypothetical protein